ncbi:MAG: hypothetical protein Q8K78_08150 [Planctomycetaceae bacterium]|nr:hypothetical protein [Planctomycetaceae bacterium]
MLRMALVVVWMAASVGWAAEGKLAVVDADPVGVSEKVAGVLHKGGLQVQVDGQAVCTLWRVETAPAKADFKSSLNVKYPFTPGQLLGVMEVVQKKEFTDFRGQEVPAGVYTLRYGQQPVDGNHVGTSELYDFVLAVPVKADVDPAAWKSPEELFKKSAATAGSNHPAIFSLLPVEKTVEQPTLTHDEAKHFWIVTSPLPIAAGKSIPVRLVVVGRSE